MDLPTAQTLPAWAPTQSYFPGEVNPNSDCFLAFMTIVIADDDLRSSMRTPLRAGLFGVSKEG